MEQDFVTFFSPGTIVAEQTRQSIPSWDVGLAVRMAKDIRERYNAEPFCFQFTTRARGDDELDSRVVKKSGLYYLPHCRVVTLEQLENDNDPGAKILIQNMRSNGWERCVHTTKGYSWAQPLNDNDTVL